jgi:hypothetical protein
MRHDALGAIGIILRSIFKDALRPLWRSGGRMQGNGRFTLGCGRCLFAHTRGTLARSIEVQTGSVEDRMVGEEICGCLR